MTPRKPAQVHPERIAPLANLPVFHKLTGRIVIMAGRGEGAIWKAELLAAAGAHIRFFTDWRDERLDALQADLALRAGEGLDIPDPARTHRRGFCWRGSGRRRFQHHGRCAGVCDIGARRRPAAQCDRQA